ncbi:MAG: hypothetical protein KC416_05015 [Myxococcales bacterium]|nr:hypothetical protein [Myxococcales bacterium]
MMRRPSNNSTPFSLLLLAVLTSACGAATPEPVGPKGPLRATDLFPMTLGTVWSYDVDAGEAAPVLAISRVTRAEQGRVEITSGSAIHPYEIRDEGIWRPGSETWLLRDPLSVGSTWPSQAGLSARVEAVAISMETALGPAEGCVRVEEKDADNVRSIRTTYCPDLGPVLVESTMNLDVSGETARVSAKLRGFSDGQSGEFR